MSPDGVSLLRQAIPQPGCPTCHGEGGRAELAACDCVRFYVVNAVCWGWFCPNTPMCGVFNSDAKETLLVCRTCKTPRPLAGPDGRPF